MSSDHYIFIGFERTGQVNAWIDGCEERDRVYLDDPTYLEIIQVDERQFVGKRIKDGAALDRIEDAARSVVSLLTRVNPRWSLSSNTALILALEEDGKDTPVVEDAENEDFDYSELVH